MPEYIRTLIVIIVLAAMVLTLAKRPACAMINQGDFTRRRNLWFALTITAFLAQNFWLFTAAATVLLVLANKREHNLPALFFSVLFALPVAFAQVPGFGLINYFVELSYPRILALVLLLPAFLQLHRRSDVPALGKLAADKWLLAYLLLSVLLVLRETTVTDALRQGFNLFIDILVPYFVISRMLVSVEKFREALLGFVIAVMILSLIGVFEAERHWLLYAPLLGALGLDRGMLDYLPRDGILRALASSGQPIVLGYLVMVGIGFYLFIQKFIPYKLPRRLGLALLIAGLLSPLSRGPWVGTAVLFIVFLATGPFAIRRLATLALVSVFAFPIVAVLPGGERIINLLPFIGKTEAGNVEYRDRLITNASIVIARNPWFGSVDYLDTPEMQSLHEGEGKIDVVNTYIGLALEKGLVGLGLFAGFFASVVFGVYRTIRFLPTTDSEERLLGRALLATLLGILLTIMTVSSIAFIPIVYWSIAGAGTAYAQMIKNRVRGGYARE
jgi:hypothetical protein